MLHEVFTTTLLICELWVELRPMMKFDMHIYFLGISKKMFYYIHISLIETCFKVMNYSRYILGWGVVFSCYCLDHYYLSVDFFL